MVEKKYPDPREEDIVYGDRRLSRPDNSLPDWEMPDTAYRPVPIVWFTGAMFLQIMTGGLLFAILASGQNSALLIGLTLVTAAGIALWTWDRGMRAASTGWKIATLVMLATVEFFFALAAVSV